MHPELRISKWFSILLMAISLWSCANIGRPSGGDKDTEGPEVIGVLPYPGTLFFNYKEIVFHFDEFLKPGSYKDEIFISPVPSIDPEIVVKNKTLTIKFLAPLRDNTTYVVSLGTGIIDFNESNKMEKSYTYAFSTGAVLDSMQFSGRVTDMWSGAGEADMKVMLFRADDIEENEILGKRPEYLVATGKEGEFEFRFLAPGQYKIYGVSDANNDSKYSGPGERIALAATPILDLNPADSVPQVIQLTAFNQDLEGPKVKSAKWSNANTIHVEFSDPVLEVLAGDSLQVEIMDTLGAGSRALTMKRFKYLDQRHLYLDAELPRDKDYDLRITHLMDTLGQRRDTTVRLSQLAQVKEERGRWVEAPINLRKGHEFLLNTFFKVPAVLDTTKIQLLDSGAVSQDVEWVAQGMQIVGRPPKLLQPGVEYTLKIKKKMDLPDGKTIDTLLTFKMLFPNPNDFGTITGRVLPDSTKPENRFSVIFKGASGTGMLTKPIANQKEAGKGKNTAAAGPDFFEARFQAPGPFRYVYLLPGKYSLDIIVDTDGNGVLTPGRLKPYLLPEKVYHQAIPMEIKAKWDVEDVEVYPIPASGKAKAVPAGTEAAPSPKGK